MKSFSYKVHEAKGYKTVTKITLYVNSIQDVDIAEMKNNWAIWQKVCDVPIDLTDKTHFVSVLPLPVTATNILVEFHTVNLTKALEFAGPAGPKANISKYAPKGGYGSSY